MSATGAVDVRAHGSVRAAREISVVMRCLNEAASAGGGIEKEWEGSRRTGLTVRPLAASGGREWGG